MVAAMAVAGQPPHVRHYDFVGGTHQAYSNPACAQAHAVASNFDMSRGLQRSTGRQSTTTAEPSLRRAKKSGACESGLAATSVQCSQNGCDAMPTIDGSKSRCNR